MTDYRQELARCRLVIILRAVLECQGHAGRASVLTGVHRNTISRTLRAAGYNHQRITALLKSRDNHGK